VSTTSSDGAEINVPYVEESYSRTTICFEHLSPFILPRTRDDGDAIPKGIKSKKAKDV